MHECKFITTEKTTFLDEKKKKLQNETLEKVKISFVNKYTFMLESKKI